MKAYLHTQSGLLIVNAMLALSVIFAALGTDQPVALAAAINESLR